MNKKNFKIIFFGSPDFAAVVLDSLIKNQFNIVSVFTQPDKKIGREQKTAFSSVKNLAIRNKIRVSQPESLKDNGAAGEIKKINPDLIVVAAYGKILPKKILEIPRFGSVNVHASLLPKYRGASPVQSAILADEKETGITLMLMNEKMDEGDILAQEKIEIGENDTAENLLEKLGKSGAEMIVKFIPEWTSKKINPRPQDGKEATYCGMIKREDGKVNWNEPAEKIYRQYRAYQPWPGIYTFYEKNHRPSRLKLTDILSDKEINTGEKPGKIVEYNRNIAVQTGKGLIVLREVQPEGKKTMNIKEFIRGNSLFKNVF